MFLKFATAGILVMLISLPLWSGSAVDALDPRGSVLDRVGVPEDVDRHVMARLQTVRNEIRQERCERGAYSYCLLGRCWTLAVPAYCESPLISGKHAGRITKVN